MKVTRFLFRLFTALTFASGFIWLVAIGTQTLVRNGALFQQIIHNHPPTKSIFPEPSKDIKEIVEQRVPHVQRYRSPTEAIFEERRLHAKQMCRRNYAFEPKMFKNLTAVAEKLRQESKRYILVDQLHQLILCRVPYADSLAWKKLLILMTGQTDYNTSDQIPDNSAKDDNLSLPSLTPMSNLAPKEIENALKNYKKVMIVRNPIERLVTAWRDLLTGNNEQYSKRYGTYIAKHYRHVPLDAKRKFPSVRLREFFEFLGKEGDLYHEPAWMPQHLHCGSCFIDWDIIGKYETIRDESPFIIAQMLGGFDKLNMKRWRLQPAPTAVKYDNRDALRTSVSQLLLDGVFQAYGPDINIFGYEDYNIRQK